MERLKLNADDEEILAVVDRWADMLAAGDYGAAFAMTYHPPDDDWTPQKMETWVNGYGFDEPLPDGRIMEVTPRETAARIDVEPYREITRPTRTLKHLKWLKVVIYTDLTRACSTRKRISLAKSGIHCL